MTILGIIIGIVAISSIFDQILSWLNLKNHRRELPEKLRNRYDAEKYAESWEYHRINYRFSTFRSWLSLFVLLGILWYGGFGWLDAQLRTITTDSIWLPLLFFGVLFIISDVFSIPFQWYHTFVIEEQFGFNKTTPRLFWIDKIKSYVLTLLIGGLVMGVLLLLVNWLEENFWIWFWGFSIAFMLGINLLYTTLLLPIFNKLTPLEGGSLRESIEAYSRKVNFPLTNIMVMDGSKRSAKSNAFFSGMGKSKKVVLFDTLLENHEEDELVAVLAHEVGHYKKKHIILGMLLSIIQSGLMLYILSYFVFSEDLSMAMGGTVSSIHLNLIAFGLLYSPISLILGIGMNIISRKNEYEADHYAATSYAAEPLKEALIRLHSDNLSNLTPHPLYVFFNYSHPTLLQRLQALEAIGD